MKKITILFAALILGSSLMAQKLPQPSPSGKLEQVVGLTDVTIEYSRPGVKDRVIFGDLIPYDKVWRTGANRPTKITFSTDVKINGQDLAAGTYAVLSFPGKDSFTFVFSKNLDSGEGNYKESDDALRVKARVEAVSHTETMTFNVANLRDASATICMSWEKTMACMDLTVAVDDEAVKNIEAKIKEIEGAYGVYNSSARYYLENNKDPKKALEWAQKSTSIQETFWNLITLSKAQAANGDYKAAIATAQKGVTKSTEAGNDAYVKMHQANIAEWTPLAATQKKKK
jgi:hypothetical protein